MKTIEELEAELQEVAGQIKSAMEELENNPEDKELKSKLKDLQWQALFYLESIHNLRDK